tara:strand:+ start:263 stop:946 length:684 start_codon:yes stop_codon:yes gene_type:complete
MQPDWLDLSSYLSNNQVKAFFSYNSFPSRSLEARNNFLNQTGFIKKSLLVPIQVHSKNVILKNEAGKVNGVDGVFTFNPDIVCSIQVADCMPIYFCHQIEKKFGIIHVGWRGLVDGIIFQSNRLLNNNGLNLDDFELIIGPSIQQCCFEVRNDIIQKFDKQFINKIDENRFKVNLQSIAISQLNDLNFNTEKIKVISECTFCNPEKYYSYRRDGKNSGRMIGIIGVQ